MVEDNDSQDLELLSKKLEAVQKRRAEVKPEEAESSAMGIAMKIGIELAVSVAVVTYLGYLIDQWLGIAPVGIIVGMILGFAAGFRNVFREAREMQDQADTENE